MQYVLPPEDNEIKTEIVRNKIPENINDPPSTELHEHIHRHINPRHKLATCEQTINQGYSIERTQTKTA